MVERYYWDACIFLSYLNGVRNRVPVIEDFLSRSRRGEIAIVTSTLSLVEVAFGAVEKDTGKLDGDTERKIDKLWADRKAIKLVEVHQLLYRDARELIRFAVSNNWSLKPADAIHLATAKRVGAYEINTFEKTAWNKYETKLGIRICAPQPVQGVFLPAPAPAIEDKSNP